MKSLNPIQREAEKKALLRRLFTGAFIMLAFALVFTLFYAFSMNKNKVSFDFDDVNLVQLQDPQENSELAVVETSIGTFEFVLYRDYAPKTVEKFVDRANAGEYNGKYINVVQDSVYFIAGGDIDGNYDGEQSKKDLIENEVTPDLWPFKGAICSISAKDGYGGFRIIGVNSIEFTEEFTDEMRAIDGNPEILEGFIENGGVPNFSQQYTVFGQVVSGMDVFEAITKVAVNNEDDLKPVEDIQIISVTIGEYHSEAAE